MADESAGEELARLLAQAQQGDQRALGVLLERYRPYLRLLALRKLDTRLESRIDASDVVQQTCLSIYKKIDAFTGSNEQQFLAWIREIHERNIQDAARDHLYTKKRSIQQEHAGGDSVWQQELPERSEESPSQRLMAGEKAAQVAQALEQLPEAQAEAVRLRYLEGLPLLEIAQRMGRSEDACAGLIKRGLQAVRRLLRTPPQP